MRRLILLSMTLLMLITACSNKAAVQDSIPSRIISPDELAAHDSQGDCWIVYEGKVYDYSDAKMHPSMAKTFFSHCGQMSGFEEAAKDRHSASSSSRVESFGPMIGVLES